MGGLDRLALVFGMLVVLGAPLAVARGPVDGAVAQVTRGLNDMTAATTNLASSAPAGAAPPATDAARPSGGSSPGPGSPPTGSADGAPPPTLLIDFPPVPHAVAGTLTDVTTTLDHVAIVVGEPPGSRAPAEPEAAPTPRAYVGHAPPAPIGSAPALPGAGLAVAALVTAAAPAVTGTSLWARLRRFAFLAPLYTRIAKERLLDHSARERLVVAVRAYPGSSVADLARASKLARNTAVYHLFRLERERLVSSVRSGRARLFFAPDSFAEQRRAPVMAAVKHPMSASIAREVGVTPGLDQHALCARFGLRPSLAHWHAQRLVKAGVVEQRRDGRYVRYYPGAQFAAAMG